MKNFNFKTILYSIIFLTVLTTLPSCNNDEEETTPTPTTPQNIITYKGTTYVTPGAYALTLERGTSEPDDDDIELAFYTEGLSYDILKEGSSTSLQGSTILIELDSPTLEGTHQVAVGKADFVIDGDFSSEQDVKSKLIESNGQGTVTVTKNGDEYSVEYTIPYEEGELVGTYTGSIEKRDD